MKCPKCKSEEIAKTATIPLKLKCIQCNHEWISNKHGAQKCECEGITFDSKLERSVYLTLREFFEPNQILVHSPILIALASPRFPQWNWKVDFQIPHLNWLIEAKGDCFINTQAGAYWKATLRALDAIQPATLERLTVVVQKADSKRIAKGIQTITLAQLELNLRRQIG
jgi:hypothetical protein